MIPWKFSVWCDSSDWCLCRRNIYHRVTAAQDAKLHSLRSLHALADAHRLGNRQ